MFKIISDAHKGMAIAGALALGVSAIVGLGFALAKGSKKWSFHLAVSSDYHFILCIFHIVINLSIKLLCYL